MKRFLPTLFVFLLSLTFIPGVFALELTNIGGLSLGGAKYTEWWYSSVAPTYSGTAKASSDVSVKVGNTTYDTKANSTGAWSVSSVDQSGDYDVTVSGDGTTYAFKLHLGQNVPANLGSTTSTPAITTNASGTPVPSTGSEQLVSIMFSLGVLLLSSYLYFYGSQNSIAKFEKYILES